MLRIFNSNPFRPSPQVASCTLTDEDLIRIARTARLIPGEGGIDLPGIARRLPPDITVSVEVPNHALARQIGRTELAQRALTATKALFNDGTTA